MIMKKTSLLLITCITFCSTLIAQDKKDAPKWDVSNPQGTYKDVNFTTSEGTWMNLDVSPDGKEIIFESILMKFKQRILMLIFEY